VESVVDTVQPGVRSASGIRSFGENLYRIECLQRGDVVLCQTVEVVVHQLHRPYSCGAHPPEVDGKLVRFLVGKGSISQETVDEIRTIVIRSMGYIRREQRKDKGPAFKYVCILQWEDAPFLRHFSQPSVLQLEMILVEEGFRPIIIHKLPELTDIALYNEIGTAKAGLSFWSTTSIPISFSALRRMVLL
jgi:hypothetical protein